MNQLFIGIDDQNQIFIYNTTDPGTVIVAFNITDVGVGETLTNIDFRPATGDIYATSNKQLYLIDGAIFAVYPIGSPIDTTLYGNIIGMEFDAVTDTIIFITDTGMDMLVSPITGEQLENITINNATVSLAVDNNLSGASTSTLYFLDATTSALYKRNSTSDTNLIKVGSGLGINITATIGFDIAPNGQAIACVQISDTLSLYLVDLTSGTLSQKLGNISESLTSIAVQTAGVAYATQTSNNQLLYLNIVDSNYILTSKNITGLQPNETIIGIDLVPPNGILFGLGSSSRLYSIDMGSAAAEAVGSDPFTPALNGTAFGMDFNPVSGLFQVVGNTGQSIVIDLGTGNVTKQYPDLNPGMPSVTAIAFTDNYVGAENTTLYGIDTSSNQLVQIEDPETSALTDIGPLGVVVDDNNGFDISGASGLAYALLTVNGSTSLYAIDLDTGVATIRPKATYPIGVTGFTLGFNV